VPHTPRPIDDFAQRFAEGGSSPEQLAKLATIAVQSLHPQQFLQQFLEMFYPRILHSTGLRGVVCVPVVHNPQGRDSVAPPFLINSSAHFTPEQLVDAAISALRTVQRAQRRGEKTG
jgi:hypothetical protein